MSPRGPVAGSAPAATPTACGLCEVHAESTFRVEGMDCHEEVAILEKRLGRVPGVHGLTADVMGQRLLVKHDAARVGARAIADVVSATGMRAWLERDDATPTQTATTRWRQRLVVASGASLAVAVALHAAGAPMTAVIPPYVASIVTGGVFTVRRALAAVRARALDINALMTIAVTGAVILGEWFEAATVVFLFAVAQWLETRSLDRARRAIRALMDLAPAEATVRRQGRDERVPLAQVAVGDLVLVGPGEKIPMDGVVVAGHSDVNQAPVTGESLPAAKQPGDRVFAGSINGAGALDVDVSHVAADSTLARIIHLVEQAQAQRAPAQAFVDRFARIYTPAVLALSGLVAIVPTLILGQPPGEWVYRALVLLIIACPCALVISTPVSIVSALAAAARHGVLIKGGLHLERAAAVRCLAFDKTGTLTRGEVQVVDAVALDGADPLELLATAATVERRSEHAIGRAFVRRAEAAGAALGRVARFRALPGLGAEGEVDGRRVVVGSHRFFEQVGLCGPDAHARALDVEGAGQTPVLLAIDGRPVGLFALADVVRPSARDTVELLRDHGVEHVVMLTGDAEPTARAVARDLGLDDYIAELLPGDKVAAVEALKQRYGVTAMVGDGVNDAPALAAADVGIVMGAAGTDAAIETADVALMADELAKIPFALRLSRATVTNIKTNIALSVGIKAVFLGLAVAGAATLWMAVVADVGASLLVIGNGLRLLRTT
ncbi:MAG: cadmium-translocating P-type ATPase [Acidobacteria bacterium]|nr:cadmium-translocating P-type ATPase [Acidobacteriota bacterium]